MTRFVTILAVMALLSTPALGAVIDEDFEGAGAYPASMQDFGWLAYKSSRDSDSDFTDVTSNNDAVSSASTADPISGSASGRYNSGSDKDHFVVGVDITSESLAFADADALTANVSFSVTDDDKVAMRAVIQIGSDWYISSTNLLSNGGTSFSIDFSTESWNVFEDPAGGFERINFDYLTTATPQPSGNLKFVGFGIDHNRSNRITQIDDVQLTGTAIPEPASLALMGLGGLVMLGRGRCRAG